MVIHTEKDFAAMRRAGRLAAQLLDWLEPQIQAGISTGEINRLAHAWTRQHGAISAPLGYRGFPASLCTSANSVVCHGIPSDDEILQDGDIVNVDVTPQLDGWHGDTSRTFMIGKVSARTKTLIRVTEECLEAGIAQVRPGAHIGDIGAAIEAIAHAHGFGVVREFCGHGTGRVFHDAPYVPHFGQRGAGPEIVPGLVFTIEPMLNEKSAGIRVLEDGWTVLTADGRPSAQFEHTLGVTEEGCEVFTRA